MQQMERIVDLSKNISKFITKHPKLMIAFMGAVQEIQEYRGGLGNENNTGSSLTDSLKSMAEHPVQQIVSVYKGAAGARKALQMAKKFSK